MNKSIGSLLISLFLVAMVATGLSVFQTDIATNYALNTTNITYLEASGEALGQLEEMEGKITSSNVDPAAFIISGGWKVLQLLFMPINILISLLTDIAAMLQLPIWVVTGFTGLIITVVLFAVIRAIFKVEV